MFRDGHYLEVIKAADDCLATAVVTVQEKTVEIKNRKVITNKWLKIEDWAALYKILERAILRNGRDDGSSLRKDRGREWRKSTRQLEVTYTFEHSESTSGATFLPTIKVNVSSARKKSTVKRETNEDEKRSKTETEDETKNRTKEKSSDRTTDAKSDRSKKTPTKTKYSPTKIETAPPRDNTSSTTARDDFRKKRIKKYKLSEDLENASLEEYIPDAPKAKRSCLDFKYVPSRKSALEGMRSTSNEYTPTLCDSSKHVAQNVNYVPNSIEKLEAVYETYEPCATTLIPDAVLEEYVPNSKGVKSAVEEYEPDFKSPCKLTFDDSYVPSSVQKKKTTNDSRKTKPGGKSEKLKRPERRKETLKRKMSLFS
ncbi:uncharacterized protein LOC109852059 isoform X2 [Pseudomyrmex gracilis]|uniref:uncharacterized protein LOC109852059 isoform X2 n=1 Tax=Pseudomyrmex gracilis TaxID=219809 RepID=UPI000995DA71|nr:uncharacterized protein LOC109852059 isoform X2 [Pseudomyrmex gracilis]